MKIVKPGFEIIPYTEPKDALKKIEVVGRTCYKSEDKITDSSCETFVAGIIKRTHEAVLEHFAFIFEMDDKSYNILRLMLDRLEDCGFNSFLRVTYDRRPIVSGNVRAWRDIFKFCKARYTLIPCFMMDFVMANPILFPEFSEDDFDKDNVSLFKQITVGDLYEGVEYLTHTDITVRLINDRGVSHEEVRHRVASFAQESTRYCNYSKDKFGNEVTYIDLLGGMRLDPKMSSLPAEAFGAIYDEWIEACKDAEQHYNKMIELGASPQIARSVLNNSTKTEICVTLNVAGWLHFFSLRCSPAAHPQIRENAIPLLDYFKKNISDVFDSIEVNVA